jgi:hypothetical protein
VMRRRYSSNTLLMTYVVLASGTRDIYWKQTKATNPGPVPQNMSND